MSTSLPAAAGIMGADMTVTIVRSSDPACEPTCPEWIALSGTIVPSSVNQVSAALLATSGQKSPILISSSGGSIQDAIKIGKLIRAAGRTVAVGHAMFGACQTIYDPCEAARFSDRLVRDAATGGLVLSTVYKGKALDYQSICYSACPLILSGGTRRVASYGSSVGLHESTRCDAYAPGKMEYELYCRELKIAKAEELHLQISDYLKLMGIAPEYVAEMQKASNTEMNIVNEQTMARLRITNASDSATHLTAPAVCRNTKAITYCVRSS